MRVASVLWIAIAVFFLSSVTKSKVVHKHYEKTEYQRKPVVLVPGVLGNRLEAKLNLTVVPDSWWCKKIRNWYDIWLSISEFFYHYVICWVYEISIEYQNGDPRRPMNRTGVEIQVEDFGGTSSFEYLDSYRMMPFSPYFNQLVAYLVGLGYTRHGDMKGAPYDWRLTPSVSNLFLGKLKKLIEDNFVQHSNQRVVIIGHSMGNLFLYYFLKHQPQSWKDKYIDSFISINAPYLGAVKALKSVTSGETEGHDYFLPRLKMREASRTFPSSYLLLPRPSLWPANSSLVVSTSAKQYTVNDYEIYFKHIDCEECWERWKNFGNEMGDLSAPNVEVHCIYSSEIATSEVLVYDHLPDGAPHSISGSGDGSVPTFSSSYCLNWRNQQSQPVHNVPMPWSGHVGILFNSSLHYYIGNVTAKPIRSLLKPLTFELL